MFQQRPLEGALTSLRQHQLDQTADDRRLHVDARRVLEVVAQKPEDAGRQPEVGRRRIQTGNSSPILRRSVQP